MTVWSHLPTIFKQRRALQIAGLLTLCVALITTLFLSSAAHAAPGVNKTLTFQGRLLNSSGGVVPDGNYNMQFKIYQDGDGQTVGTTGSPAGTPEWTESYLNDADQGVVVKNGYFSVNLGARTAFGTSIDWTQDTLWLSMNVAGRTDNCTPFASCNPDGEMLPMKRLTAVPYAMSAENANTLEGLSASDFIQNQNVSAQSTTNFWIDGTGKAAGGLQGPSLDALTSGTLSIGSATATTIDVGTGTNTQTINLGTGAGPKTVTLGSANTTSSTTIQGGTAGVKIRSYGGFAYHNLNTGFDIFTINATNNIVFNPNTMDINVSGSGDFRVNDADGVNYFRVGNNGAINTNWNTALTVNGAATFDKGITIQGNNSNITYTTPNGYNLKTAINIPNYTVGAYDSILAFGLPSTSAATARGILIADGRTSAHQATIGVLSPNENNIMGFSWNGSNSTGYLANTANSLALQGNGLNLLTATNNGGAANVGIGNNASSGYALDVTGDINTSTQLRIGGVSTLTSSSLTFSNAGTSTITSASGQSLTLDGKSDTTIKTNGTTRATFDTSNTLYLGNGTASAAPTNFTIQATNSSATAVAGAALTIQGGNATTGNANGGNLALDAGAKSGGGTGGSVLVGSTNASAITIGNSSANIVTTLVGTTVIKPVSGNNSTTAFQLQRANGTAMLVSDSTNQTITFGNPASANKTVISTATGQIIKYGTARNAKTITLNAEYTGSVLDAGSGANNNGTMTSSVDLTERMNYYKWTTSQGSNQNYDIVVQVPLPTDFDGWANANPLSIATYTNDTTNGTVTLEARDSTGAIRCNFVSVTPGSTNTWATNNSACTLSSGTYTAGDSITLRIRMQSPNAGDVRVGNIKLDYLSKH